VNHEPFQPLVDTRRARSDEIASSENTLNSQAFSELSSLSRDVLQRIAPAHRAWALAEAIRAASPAERATLAPWLLELATPRVSQVWMERSLAWLSAVVSQWQSRSKPTTREHVLDVAGSNAAIGALASCFVCLPAQAQEVALVLGAGKWKTCVPSFVQSDDRDNVQASLAQLAGRAGEAQLLAWVERAATIAGASVHAERSLCAMALAAHPKAQRIHIAELLAGSGLDAAELAAHAPRFPEYVGAARWELLREVIAIIRRLTARTDAPASLALSHAAMIALSTSLAHTELRGATESDSLVRTLARALRFAESPLARVRALAWCREPSLKRACIARLSTTRSKDQLLDHEALLTHWHLCLHPGRFDALASVPVRVGAAHGPRKGMSFGPRLALPGPTLARKLSTPARAGLPLMAKAMHVQAKAREAMLEPLLVDASARVRHALARHCPQPLLQELAWDTDDRVAHTALLRALEANDAMREKREQLELLGTLSASPHARVRAMSRSQTHALDASTRRDIRTGMLAREELVAQIRVQLAHKQLATETSEQRAQRHLLGLQRAKRRGLLSEPLIASDCLLLSLPGVDDRVRATAVMALSWAHSAAAAGAIASSLNDTHERVRANAVEALSLWTRRFARHTDVLSTPHASVAITHAAPSVLMQQAREVARSRTSDATHHRERANAAMLAAMAQEELVASNSHRDESAVKKPDLQPLSKPTSSLVSNPASSQAANPVSKSVSQSDLQPVSAQRALETPASAPLLASSLIEPRDTNAYIALSTTLAMLQDQRAEQRTAGLWLAWKLCSQRDAAVLMEARGTGASHLIDERRATLLECVREIAEGDQVQTLRARAEHLAAWLQGDEQRASTNVSLAATQAPRATTAHAQEVAR
jgi:hypothetical protein